MAALKVNLDNSITMPIPLLGVLLTLILALAGWGNSIRTDVVDLKAWKESHTREVSENKAAIAEHFKSIETAIQVKADKDDKWRADIQETLTQIRIAVGARPSPSRTVQP